MNGPLQGVDVFVAVAEAGSFAAAATRLNLTRSAVGKSLARLEARLGVRLIQRSTRHQQLTPEGQMYLLRCRRALAELGDGRAELDASRSTLAGRLRITCPELIGRRCIAPLLLELRRAHPALSIHLHLSDRVQDLIEDGFDVALRSGPLSDTPLLAARRIGQQQVGIYASPDYLRRHPRPKNAASLNQLRDALDFVGYTLQPGRLRWLFSEDDGQSLALDLPTTLDCNSLEVALDCAAAGWGLTRLPCWLAAEAVAQGRLERVFVEQRAYGYPLHLVWPQHAAMPLRLRRLIDWLIERLPPLLDPGATAGPATAGRPVQSP